MPKIDCRGKDVLMFKTAQQDLMYYLMIKWRIYNPHRFRDKFLETLGDEGGAVKIFIDNFIGTWYKKWQERVKIVTSDTDPMADKRQMTKMLKLDPRAYRIVNQDRYLMPLVECLFRHGDFACTRMLAERTLMMTVVRRGKPPKGAEEEVNFLSTVMNHIAAMSQTKGQVIFIKLGKMYFKEDKRNEHPM